MVVLEYPHSVRIVVRRSVISRQGELNEGWRGAAHSPSPSKHRLVNVSQVVWVSTRSILSRSSEEGNEDHGREPQLNARSESTVNDGATTMSLPFKKRQNASASLHRTEVPSRYAHCSSHDSRGSKVAASPQLKRARAWRFTLVQVVVEVDEQYAGLKTCRWGPTGTCDQTLLDRGVAQTVEDNKLRDLLGPT